MRGKLFPLILCLTLFALGVGIGIPTRAASKAKAEGLFRVRGDVSKSGVWTVARVEKELQDYIRGVNYTYKGDSYTSRCISLLDFVRAAGPKAKKGVGNPLLGMTAAVRAGNGYTVSFGLGELLPEYGNKEIWIVLDRNGKPLPADEGPVRLLIPSEPERRERWVYGIRSFTVVDGAKAGK